MSILIQVVGWSGALLIITAYALLSSGRLQGRSVPYQLLTFLGSACFVANGAYHGAWPLAGLNFLYMCIGAVMLVRFTRRRPAA